MPKPALSKSGSDLVQTFADERISSTVRYFGHLVKRNEHVEHNRLFLKKWFDYWVILEDHYLRFYADVPKNRTPHTHDKMEEVGSIDIAHCRVDHEVLGYGARPFLFRATTEPGARFLLEATSEDEYRGWIAAIETAALVDDAQVRGRAPRDSEDSGSHSTSSANTSEDEQAALQGGGEDGDGGDDEASDEERDEFGGSQSTSSEQMGRQGNKAVPYFRKVSQAETEKTVRLKRKNVISGGGGDAAEILEVFKFEGDSRRSSRNLEDDAPTPSASAAPPQDSQPRPKKSHTWERVMSRAEITPLIQSAAVHFKPQSGYLTIRGGRFGKAWGRFWCEIRSFADHEMFIYRKEDLKEKVGRMDLSLLTCIEEVSAVDSLHAFEITVEGEKYVVACEEEKLSTSWFETFSLVQKHLVAGEKRPDLRPVPERRGWLMKRLGAETPGSSTVWKSRWCELYETYLQFYDNEKRHRLLGKININERTKVVAVRAEEARGDVTALKQLRIVIHDKAHIFMAASQEERDAWVTALRTNSLLLRVGSRHEARRAVPERAGFLKKSDITGNSRRKIRYVKQRGAVVAYYLNEKAAAAPLGRFTLRDATLTAAAAETEIEVYAGTRCFVLTAENEVERNEWLESLNAGVEYAAATTPSGGASSSAAAAAGGAAAARRKAGGQTAGDDDDLFSEEEIVISAAPQRAAVEFADEERPAVRSKLLLKQVGVTRIWKVRFLVLRGVTLFYYKSRQSKRPSGVLVLSKSAAAFAGEEVQSWSFVVVSETRRLVFGTSSQEERNGWLEAVNEAIRRSPFATNSEQFGDFSEEDQELDAVVDPLLRQQSENATTLRGRSGWLEKQNGRKEWVRRWFVQRGPLLSYYADDQEAELRGQILLRVDDGIISPRNVKTKESEPLPFIIETAEGRKLSLMARDRHDLTKWVAELKKAVALSASSTPAAEPVREFSDTEGEAVRSASLASLGGGSGAPAAAKGWLLKQSAGGKVWRKRWFVCQRDVLTYFRNSAVNQACGQMVLRHGDAITPLADDPEHPHGFSLSAKYPPRRIRLAAASREDMELWMGVLAGAIPREASWQDDGDVQELSETEDPRPAAEASPHFSFIVSDTTRGHLLKLTGQEREKAWKRRYFVQRGPYVSYYRAEQDERPLGRFKVTAADVFNSNLLMKSQQRVFRLTTSGGRTVTMAALTAPEYDEWVRALYWLSSQEGEAVGSAAGDALDADLSVYSETGGEDREEEAGRSSASKERA